jgi:hypothetical protein
MKASSETRLQKLETFHSYREARMLVIEGNTPAERDAYVRSLIESGTARESDTFIHTGVPRSEQRYTGCRTIPDLMERIAAHETKTHDPRN